LYIECLVHCSRFNIQCLMLNRAMVVLLPFYLELTLCDQPATIDGNDRPRDKI
jgi:hypothetical protein